VTIKVYRRQESVSATLHEGQVVQIVIVRICRGVDVGGTLWLSLDAVPWLVEALQSCLDTLQSSKSTIGPDSLRVKEKGRELDPQVGIGNWRSGSVPHTGKYFVAMRETTVRDLFGQLRALTA
jgi:hypothetical protein